tara:strand:- start:4659 stop:5366 length:708 start_codon:yes stop_codon:yes gene_type:complete
MNNKFWIVSMPTYSMIIFIILNIIAMACYPGGNLNDPSQVGYFFRYNFFSDLGMTISHSKETNMISCILFNSSLCIVGVTFIMLFFTIKNLFLEYKLLSTIAAILGIIGGISFIGVAFTPSDLYLDLDGNPWLHIVFAHWIFRSLSSASIILSILIIKTEGFDNKYAYNFIVFGLMVLVYVLYSELYLKDARLYPEYLIKHVLSQKMVVLWIIISIYLYSIGVGKYLSNKLKGDG